MMMKQSITKILLTILISMMGANAFAYDIAVKNADGVTIYYNYINDGKELEVTYMGYGRPSYGGNIVIPEEVAYMDRNRKVTSIGELAFYYCSKMTSVTIPKSVKRIENRAFDKCSDLISVHITDIAAWCNISFFDYDSNPLYFAHHLFLNGEEIIDLFIPNSVTSIADRAFDDCSSLTSVTIPNSVTSIGYAAFCSCSSLTSVTIGNSVTSIGDTAFSGCSSLTSVTIPNSVISIGVSAFSGCSGLTSVTIGNSVTSIGVSAFSGCSGLTSVKMGNSVTSIGDAAFRSCSSLTSITIPNSVTSIGDYAFLDCSSLTSVTIGNSVTSIGRRAFDGWNLPVIISLIEKPLAIIGKTSSSRTFSQNTFNNATLYVPVGTIDKYKATNGWKDFLFIEEGTGPNGCGETPGTKKCATPIIGYQNGKLTFNCKTEGATCQYTITDDDIKSGSANEIQLGVTYRISVYATKSGYDNSETATATLCWIDVDPKTEGITNNVAQVRAKAVLIQSNGNILTISGADEGTPISVYAVNGQLLGTSSIISGQTSVPTPLQSGSVAIVKIGDKSVKVLMK